MEKLILLAAAKGDSLPEQFGVTWELLLSQCIAFLVLAFALKKFAYGPVLKVLEDRKQRIAEGIENADKIKAELASTQDEKDRILSEANQKAQELIDEARVAAEKVREAKTQDAMKEAEEIIRKAGEATEANRKNMEKELTKKLGKLVVKTTEEVIGREFSETDNQRLIEETNKKLAA